MWKEVIKDFGIAFLLVWLAWPLTSTILYMPFEIVSRFSRLKISTTTKRQLIFCSLLLVFAFSLLVRSGQEYLWHLYTRPLNPPLNLDLGSSL